VNDLTDLPERLSGVPAAGDGSVARAGDVWLLSWDGAYLGAALAAAVHEGYILAWPVTFGEPVAYRPALVIDNVPYVGSAHLWPTRETGIGMHLLDRPLGHLMETTRVRAIWEALRERRDPGLAFAPLSPNQESVTEAMVDQWTAMCFHTWPSGQDLFLSEDRIKRCGGSSAMIASVLGLTPPRLRALWSGTEPATGDQVEAIAAALGVAGDDVIGEDPLGDVVARLSEPRFKAGIIAAGLDRGLDEGRIRELTRAEYALAARDDSSQISDRRLFDALNRVASGA